MAPGFNSPYNHPLSPDSRIGTISLCPFLAALLCVSIILCLMFFVLVLRTSTDHDWPDMPAGCPEMALDQISGPKYLAVHNNNNNNNNNDPRRPTTTHIHESTRPGDGQDGDRQPLLQAENNRGSGDGASSVEMAAQRGYTKESMMTWHGANTLNTSWGWMT